MFRKVSGKYVLPNDTYLVSYPKSGNTWLRYMLTLVRSGGDRTNLSAMERFVPDIYRASNRQLLTVRFPRLLKSHERYTPAYKRVVYLARDPRSVFISLYWHHQQTGFLPESTSLSAYLPRFLESDERWGPWSAHVSGWLDAREATGRFLILRYEDLLADPIKGLQKVLHFLKIEASDRDLSEVVRESRLQKLRERERDERWAENRFPVRRDLSFFRCGRADEWRGSLSPVEIDNIETVFSDEMSRLGYLTHSAKTTAS